VYAALRMLLRKQSLSVKHFFTLYLAVLAGLLMLFLGLTGRLHPLFAVIGAMLPFAARLLPWIGRGTQAFSLFKYFQGLAAGSGPAPTGPPQSEIKTRFLHIILVHSTGMMDGKVLEGTLQGSDLSNLSLEQLLFLLDECRVDGDSLNVLQAYLDRQHEGWREQYGGKGGGKDAGGNGVASGNLTRQQAYEVLGLDSGASREEIINAHRKLIQKMHPDRGGSTYLAARINEAKDQLMGK
jgi:hypothetical protein